MVELPRNKNLNEYLTFKNYDVFLSLEQEVLRITTVNHENEKSKFAELNSSQISNLSKGFIEEEEGLFSLIQDAITKPSENIEISIQEDAFIIYLSIDAPVKKKIQIKIKLEDEECDPIVRLRKIIQLQRKKIEKLTNKIELDQPLLEKSLKVTPLIKTGTSFCSNYTITCNGRIATRNANANGTYYHLHAQDPLAQENFTQYFEVKLSSQTYPKAPLIFVGLGTANLCSSTSANIYASDGAYFIHCNNGLVYRSGINRPSTLFTITDSILRIHYNYSKQLIWFELDGNFFKYSILKEHRNEKFFPMIMCSYNLETIEFL